MTAVHPEASRQAVVEAALVLLERMGLSPADLAAVPPHRQPVPTFAEYVPVVSAAVSAGTRRAYGSYWIRVLEHWGDRHLDEPTPSEIRQLMAYVKTHVVARRNARGGRSAEEHLVASLRCLYRRAVDDGLIAEADNPARKVAKPRRLPTTRRALPDTRLAEINEVAARTGDDPELDTLLLRLHTETACRRGGALALRPRDLDPEQCLVLLREKGETVRWQPVSPTLMGRLVEHGRERHAPADGQHCDGSRSVVMGRVLVQDRPQMPLAEDEHPVSDLRPGGKYESFGMSVRARAAGRDRHGLDAGVSQDRVERLGELPGPVTDQVPEVRGAIAQVHRQAADLLRAPPPVRVRGHAEDVHAARADLHDEQAVQAPQGHRAVHVEEVDREHRGCLCVQELPPGRVGMPPGRRRDPQGLENPADGGSADPVADLK